VPSRPDLLDLLERYFALSPVPDGPVLGVGALDVPVGTPEWPHPARPRPGVGPVPIDDVRAALAELTDDRLDDVRTVAPIPEWGTESHTVQACFRVLAAEHVEHRRYAVRDLARLPGPGGAPAATPD